MLFKIFAVGCAVVMFWAGCAGPSFKSAFEGFMGVTFLAVFVPAILVGIFSSKWQDPAPLYLALWAIGAIAFGGGALVSWLVGKIAGG